MNDIMLEYQDITLRPLTLNDEMALTRLANDPSIWTSHPLDLTKPEIFKAIWFDKALEEKANQKRVPLTIFIKNKVIGSTSYYKFDDSDKSVKIGYTWLDPKTWGTSVNATIKYLMLEYAFTTLKVENVFLTIDETNNRSQNAAKKLGFTYHKLQSGYISYPEGTIRGAHIFGVNITEWNSMKIRLQKIMNAHANKPTSFAEKYLRYYDWAVKRTMSDVAGITADDFTKTTPMSLSTIQQLLQHLYYYDMKTYQKITLSSQNLNEIANIATKDELCEKLLTSTKQWLDRLKQYTSNDAQEKEQLLIQFSFHQIYHLGQLNACLSFLGYSPMSLDVYKSD